MSLTYIYAVRPLHGLLGPHAGRTAFLQAHLSRLPSRCKSDSRQSSPGLVLLHVQQKRYQSDGGRKFSEQPPAPSAALLLRAVRQSLSLRPLAGAFRGQSLQRLYRQSPEELVIALAL